MPGNLGTVTWTLFLLLLAPGLVEPQACMFPCQCPSQPLQCPAGTSHVWDACGCCKVCAQQLGELCSLHRPCDHHKGLYCDFSKIHRGSGICLAHEGATCDLLGKIYLNGESFQPTCKLQCICMDGAIGCIPLCSDDLRLPSPECPSPQRVKFPKKCCEEWVCEEGSEDNHFGTATAEKSPAADADNSEQQQAKEEEGATTTQKQESSVEEGAQPTPERQPQRQKASNGDTPTHEEQGKKERRASEGRGLSRLFSSFLRRPKSQVSEEDKDADAPKEAGDGHKDAGLGASPDEDILVKAPIAAPEPELKTDPSLDLHSLSSAETQPAQEERRDDQEPLERDLEDREEGEAKEEGAKPEPKPDSLETKADKDLKAAQKAVKRHRNMYCKVVLLDDTIFECSVDKHTKGQDLLKKVCDHLNLLEEDYFGLATWDTPTSRTWLDPAKEIKKQVHGGPWDFTFNVKFYPPDPAQLTEDITRYYLCLQLRQDILTGRLPCSFATLALLGSYTVQSELGDYDPDLHGPDYITEFKLAPNQTKELEEKVVELHKTYRSMTPAQADLEFLENAKKLSMYGVDLHQAKDLEGVDITLGVCSSGLLVYKDKLRINRFPWPKVLKISYKRSSFFIKIRPGEQEQYESTIGFKLPSYRAAKKLWKVCVEHHTFFRLTSTEAIPKSRFLALGSKFRYSGRTQAQTRQASALIDRPAPQFERTASKRASRSLDGAVAVITPERSPRPTSAPAIAQSHPAEPAPAKSIVKDVATSKVGKETAKSDVRREEFPLEKPEEPVDASKVRKTHTEVTVPTTNGAQPQQPAEKEEELIRMRKKRSKRLDGENIYIRHSNLMLEDLDKTQEEIKKHHANISELKKNFMESVPEPRPSEWDKRLSTHSPFRSLNVNGQIPTGADGPPLVKTQTVTISDVSSAVKSEIPTKEVPIVHTETKTITYEAAQTDGGNGDLDPGILLTAQTITSETTSSTTTTQITKTVKGGISETRIEKRIVITGDADVDHDQVLAQAIKAAKEQHPDMSVTKVVVHQETEIAEE
ncbi:protein 4.1 isoform X21 [Motacilla alba alba]|uniref:protein 4.1 isoform X21 n=1 Tax=Motacilla alba alba TaxID=1094192 RepID=UPI0018D50DBA|nr:protein 4.1 isoform X21 [Motacilla alba alba]